MESTDPSTGANKGLEARARYCAESQEFNLLRPIQSDIFFQERLLLNSVDLRIKLTRAKDEFCLMSAQVSISGSSSGSLTGLDERKCPLPSPKNYHENL
jgi:hypothetical protein